MQTLRKAIVTIEDEIKRLQQEQLKLAQQQFQIYQKLEACYTARDQLLPYYHLYAVA